MAVENSQEGKEPIFFVKDASGQYRVARFDKNCKKNSQIQVGSTYELEYKSNSNGNVYITKVGSEVLAKLHNLEDGALVYTEHNFQNVKSLASTGGNTELQLVEGSRKVTEKNGKKHFSHTFFWKKQGTPVVVRPWIYSNLEELLKSLPEELVTYEVHKLLCVAIIANHPKIWENWQKKQEEKKAQAEEAEAKKAKLAEMNANAQKRWEERQASLESQKMAREKNDAEAVEKRRRENAVLKEKAEAKTRAEAEARAEAQKRVDAARAEAQARADARRQELAQKIAQKISSTEAPQAPAVEEKILLEVSYPQPELSQKVQEEKVKKAEDSANFKAGQESWPDEFEPNLEADDPALQVVTSELVLRRQQSFQEVGRQVGKKHQQKPTNEWGKGQKPKRQGKEGGRKSRQPNLEDLAYEDDSI